MPDHTYPSGYAGALLRVDLTTARTDTTRPDPDDLRAWIGGTGLGVSQLESSAPPTIAWDDARNPVYITSGPLAGTRVSGGGNFSAVFKGPMTNMAGATQANGFFGAYLRTCGFDGLALTGAAASPVWLLLSEGGAELRDASALWGQTTDQTAAELRRALGVGPRDASIFAIGPAGEHGCYLSGLVGDNGHIAAHNGFGAVLGAKRLKAIVALRGHRRPAIADDNRLRAATERLFESARAFGGGSLYKWGSAGGLSGAAIGGWLPIRNYTTSIFPEHEQVNGQYLRTHFGHRPSPCYACRVACCHTMEVTEGPYTGLKAEEPEYEGMASFGPNVGVTEAGAAMMLCTEADSLGLDLNEAGWVVSFAMEAYERGILTRADCGGLDLTWGNAEAARALLGMVARRQGIGDVLAGGVKRAAEHLGGEALEIGIYTEKGTTPRSHDHRARWAELFDTCTSNTSTIEATFGGVQWERMGLEPVRNRFAPDEVARANAAFNGWHQFDDSLGVCRFCFTDASAGLEALNAITGWDFTLAEALAVGRRIVNTLRVYNIRHGLRREQERPSRRYGSVPVDGPVAGTGIMPHWDAMLRDYYTAMGWEADTGRPTAATLTGLGLGRLVGTY